MRIESDHVSVVCPTAEVFEFLCDLNNFEQLLPQDKYSNWESTADYCSFKVQSATIDLAKKEVNANDLIVLTSGDKAPFPYTLNIRLSEKGESTEGFIEFEGQVNQFLQMMVESPLKNLFNHMAKRLVEIKSQA